MTESEIKKAENIAKEKINIEKISELKETLIIVRRLNSSYEPFVITVDTKNDNFSDDLSQNIFYSEDSKNITDFKIFCFSALNNSPYFLSHKSAPYDDEHRFLMTKHIHYLIRRLRNSITSNP